MRPIALLFLLVGCTVDEDAPENSDPVARVVGWNVPAQRLTTVSMGNGVLDTDPAISADGLELFFISTRGGNPHIYMSARASTSSPWATPALVASLGDNATTSEHDPDLSDDGLTIFFTRRTWNGTTTVSRLYTATRPIRSLAWNVPTLVKGLEDVSAEAPNLSPNGQSLYFTKPDAANYELYRAALQPDASWAVVGPINRWNSTLFEDSLTTTRDEAYFESNRGGAWRLYISVRSPDTGWSIPDVVEELPGGQLRADVTADGRDMVFTMSPNGGEPDIYEVRR